MTDKKVVDFKAARSQKQKEQIDAAASELEETKQFIDDFAYTIMIDIVNTMIEFGYDPLKHDDTMADLVACNEAIRGLLSRTKGINFPFHDFAERIYEQIFGPTNKREALENFIKQVEKYS